MTVRDLISLALIIVLANAYGLMAQSTYSVSGTVTDQSDNKPIAGAQIFLNGSTIGTTSDSQGTFVLKRIPEGAFEMIVSFLGYENAVILIESNQPKSAYKIKLTPKIYELDEIVVKPEPKEWKKNYNYFNTIFIGTGPFSDKTKIKNPEVLSFQFDEDSRIFKAAADKPLIIENKALGYTINYWLEYFKVDQINRTFSFAGRPFFEPMKTKRKLRSNRWEKRRRKAYLGSFLHFTRALINNSTSQEGFIVRYEHKKDGRRVVSDTLAEPKSFFAQIDSTTFQLKSRYSLNVTYLNELEDRAYVTEVSAEPDSVPRTKPRPQNSQVIFTKELVLVHKSGLYYDPTALIHKGYWGFEKISDLMPLDYTLPKK